MKKQFTILLILSMVLAVFHITSYAGNDLSGSRSTIHDVYEAIPAPNDIVIDGKGGVGRALKPSPVLNSL